MCSCVLCWECSLDTIRRLPALLEPRFSICLALGWRIGILSRSVRQKELAPQTALFERRITIDIGREDECRIGGELIGGTIADSERATRWTHIPVVDRVSAVGLHIHLAVPRSPTYRHRSPFLFRCFSLARGELCLLSTMIRSRSYHTTGHGVLLVLVQVPVHVKFALVSSMGVLISGA